MADNKPAMHGQWRMTTRELDNGTIYITEIAFPILICKQWIRGWRAFERNKKRMH